MAAAAIALVPPTAVLVGTLGDPSFGPTRGYGQGPYAGIPAAWARGASAAKAAGLHPREVIWFDNGFYVELKDSAESP